VLAEPLRPPPDARLDAAQQDLGIATLPEFAAARALQRGELVQVLADWELEAQAYVGSVWLLYPPNRFLPTKVRVLIDYLIEHLNVADATSTNVPPA
jgi:DNA-binding transcriptional LysR family regulator